MKKGYWTWWQGGIGLGLVSVFAFLTYKGLGASTSYPRTVALLLNPFFPDFVANNAYFKKVPPIIDWQMMLVVGVVIGGFLAARVMGISFKNEPESSTKRKLALFLGGFLILFGARLADGCTSGHVITGITQLSVGSMLFGGMVFLVGIPAARYFARKGLY